MNAGWLERRVMRRTLRWVIALAVLVIGLAAVATGTSRDGASDAATPAGTVRSFLVSAVVDHDGFDACRYLTRRALNEVHAAAPMPDSSCESAMNFASLKLGGTPIDDEALVKRLQYRVQRSGDRMLVTVRNGQGAETFVLRRGSSPELNEFAAPRTPWRIDSGIVALMLRR